MRRRNNDYEILTAILFFALVFIFTFIMLTGFGVRETVESETQRETIRLERLDLNAVPRSAAFKSMFRDAYRPALKEKKKKNIASQQKNPELPAHSSSAPAACLDGQLRELAES